MTSNVTLKAYLLHDNDPGGKLYLAIATDCCEAAKSIIATVGGRDDVNRFSVSGSWEATDGRVIEVSRWWPYFTNNPDGVTAMDVVRSMKPDGPPP